jgi:hypothetical protein
MMIIISPFGQLGVEMYPHQSRMFSYAPVIEEFSILVKGMRHP